MTEQQLIDLINANIKQNGREEIKGQILNNVLLAMVDFTTEVITPEIDVSGSIDFGQVSKAVNGDKIKRFVINNSITNFDEDIFDTIGYSQGDIVFYEDNFYVSTSNNNNTYPTNQNYWNKIELSEGSSSTTEDVYSDVEVGGINVGDLIPAGSDLDYIVQNIFTKIEYPTFIAPTFDLTSNIGTREIGETINLTLTAAFSKGAISINGVKQNDRAGNVINYVIDDTISSSNTKVISNYKVKASDTLSASVNYAQGPQPKDSKGNDYSTPLPAGSLSKSVTIGGQYKRFFGANTGSLTARNLPQNVYDNTSTTFNLNTGVVAKIFDLYIPNNRTLTEVLDLDALNANITSQYVLQGVVQVPDAGGSDVAYKHYRMETDSNYSTTHRHQIKIA